MPEAPVPTRPNVRMPYTVMFGIVTLLLNIVTYTAIALDAEAGWLRVACVFVAAVSLVLAIALVYGQRWARYAGMGFMVAFCALGFVGVPAWFPLIAFACLYGQPATDYYNFKATGELPWRLRQRYGKKRRARGDEQRPAVR